MLRIGIHEATSIKKETLGSGGRDSVAGYIDNARYGRIAGELRFFNPRRRVSARRVTSLVFQGILLKASDRIQVMNDFSPPPIRRRQVCRSARSDELLGPTVAGLAA
jgi:hypothetical protein